MGRRGFGLSFAEDCDRYQQTIIDRCRALVRSWGWKINPALYRGADGIPGRVDAGHALGNAVVPQVAEVVGRVILELERQWDRA